MRAPWHVLIDEETDGLPVLADGLQERGDLLGRSIVAAHRAETSGDEAAVGNAALVREVEACRAAVLAELVPFESREELEVSWRLGIPRAFVVRSEAALGALAAWPHTPFIEACS